MWGNSSFEGIWGVLAVGVRDFLALQGFRDKPKANLRPKTQNPALFQGPIDGTRRKPQDLHSIDHKGAFRV